MNEIKTTKFEKIIFGAIRGIPRNEIYVYFNGMPLFARARFEGDRYSFLLPKNLKDKMLSGQLIADFTYTDRPGDIHRTPTAATPTAIVLSERYN